MGDVFITATGCKDVIVGRHFEVMKDGAVVCNTGHYDCEINLVDLEAMAKSKREIRDNCEEYLLADGRRIYVLAQGRLVNLAAAEGHPSEVMDMSFANQFLSMVRLAQEGRGLTAGVHDIPEEQDQDIARIKLAATGCDLDVLTPAQQEYQRLRGGYVGRPDARLAPPWATTAGTSGQKEAASRHGEAASAIRGRRVGSGPTQNQTTPPRLKR